MSVSKLENTPGNQRLYRIKLQEKEKLDLDLELDFDYDQSPASIFVVPMSNDKKSYFANLKKPGIKVSGSYKYEGKKYDCDKTGNCLMIMDNGRTHNPYGVAYFWGLFMTKLSDGRIVTVNLGDGMASYDNLDQGAEDFIAVDNQYYKLDVTKMT